MLGQLGQAGQHVSLATYAGQPVIVNFFASWCGPCKKETPLLARFYAEHHGRIRVIGIDSNDQTSNALKFVAREGVTYPVATDPFPAQHGGVLRRARAPADVLPQRPAPDRAAHLRRRDGQRAQRLGRPAQPGQELADVRSGPDPAAGPRERLAGAPHAALDPPGRGGAGRYRGGGRDRAPAQPAAAGHRHARLPVRGHLRHRLLRGPGARLAKRAPAGPVRRQPRPQDRGQHRQQRRGPVLAGQQRADRRPGELRGSGVAGQLSPPERGERADRLGRPGRRAGRDRRGQGAGRPRHGQGGRAPCPACTRRCTSWTSSARR